MLGVPLFDAAIIVLLSSPPSPFTALHTLLFAPCAFAHCTLQQDNNIIAIGMEDSTIQIYNVRLDEVR